jgi:PAS domain S-box-containing protein
MTNELLSGTDAIKIPGNKIQFSGTPITETVSNGFFTVDRKWTVKYWNRAAEKILGVEAKDIIGKNLWEKFAGIIPVDFYTVYHKAFLQDVPVHFEEYWGEMGAWFDVITYHCDGILSVSFKSISHPPKPENVQLKLKALAELYKLVTEITNDCLWEWNLQAGEIFWIDGGHKRVFGYQIENALIPQSFWESCIHPDDWNRVLTKLHETISGGADYIWEDEYRFKRANGDYAYVCDRGHIIYDDEKVAIRIIGATQDISSRKITEIKLVDERLAKQNEITGAVLTAQENERADIGKELHDNLNQILVTSKMYIEMARKHEDNRDMYLCKASGLIVTVIEEIRKISKTLATPGAFIGLVDSIKNLIDDITTTHPIKIELHTKGIEDQELDTKVQLDVYRIVQEQVNNILKHAKANQARIQVIKNTEEIALYITDNGIGWDQSNEKSGMGITNIKSRAELYGGRVTIITNPGEGYELEVILPLPGHK